MSEPVGSALIIATIIIIIAVSLIGVVLVNKFKDNK
jgi:hypothetical protein